MKLLNKIHALDVSAFYWCMARKHRQDMTLLAKNISKLGDGWGYIAIALMLYVSGAIEAVFLTLMFFTFGLERLGYFILKNSLKRNRPAQALSGFQSFITPSDQFSFPSGHSSAAFLFASFMVVIFPAWMWLAYSFALLVALSRIFLGVHFPTDVVVGAIFGLSVGLVCMQYLPSLIAPWF